WARNTLHMPPSLCDDSFAKELTAERLVDPDEEALASPSRGKRKLISSKAPRKWKKIPGQPNDWFDATVYAYALAWHLEHKLRLTAERWADLIVKVHGKASEPDLFSSSDASPFSKQKRASTAPSKPRTRKKWNSYT
ncbi:terminase, partial [Ochrobactrum sp. GRS2]|nr:terminase [Ochrobactrum sp. GRS2]